MYRKFSSSAIKNNISVPASELNCLDKDNYLISDNLHYNLHRAINIKSNSCEITTKRKGIYLVCFRRLNNNTNILIYNYIYYDIEFGVSIIAYILLRDYYIKNFGYKNWGHYLVVLDNQFLNINIVNNHYLFLSNSKERIGININLLFNDEIKALTKLRGGSIICMDFVINLITKLIYVGNYNIMNNILYTAFNKNYLDFVHIILGSFYNVNPDKFIVGKITYPNILNSILFVVEDLNLLLKNIDRKNFIINQGPQSWRGQINSMSSFLSYLDNDYRDSLYNHYNYHEETGSLYHLSSLKLSRKSFSFTNINQNLGNIRWYFTKATRKLILLVILINIIKFLILFNS